VPRALARRSFQAGYLFRSAIGLRYAVWALAAPLSGCTGVCDGRTCEALFPEAALVVSEAGVDGSFAVGSLARAISDGTSEDGTDWTVAPDGDVVYVGMPEVGRILRLRLDGEAFVQEAVLAGDVGDELGAALTVVGGDLWVGAPGADGARGEVSVYPDGAIEGPPTLVIRGSGVDDRFGAAVVACADLIEREDAPPEEQDDTPEVAVQAPLYAAPGVPDLAGAVFLVSADAVGEGDPADLPVFWGAEAGAGLGAAITCAEDLDLDGVVDVALGAPWAAGGAGRVYVAPALPAVGRVGDGWRVLEGVAGEWFGRSFAVLDGGALAVGGPGWSDGVGRVQVFALTAGDESELPVQTIVEEPQATPPHFGRWLAAGDLDGGGLLDLIVGAPDRVLETTGAVPLADAGRIWAWYGWSAADAPEGADASDAPFQVRGVHAFQRVGQGFALSDADFDGNDELWIPTRERESNR
jgi:FG-GAP repeat